MSLIGGKYFISQSAIEKWLELGEAHAGTTRKESARKVRVLITRLADIGIVAMQTSVFEQTLADSQIIQYGPQLNSFKIALLSLPLLKMNSCPAAGWSELPNDLSRAAEFISMAPTGNTMWISQATGMSSMGVEIGELCKLSEYLDIYDRYLIQNLATITSTAEPWVETLRFLMKSASDRKPDDSRLTITLRGCVPAQQIRNANEGVLEWIDVSRHELRSNAISTLRAKIAKCAEGMRIKPRVMLDVREEPRQSTGEGVGISEWFHGRFLHLPGIAVIASDRSMDFLSRPTRSATSNGNSQGFILTEVVRDNGFVRWPQSQFSEAYLQARWAGQVSLQKGGPVEILP